MLLLNISQPQCSVIPSNQFLVSASRRRKPVESPGEMTGHGQTIGIRLVARGVAVAELDCRHFIVNIRLLTCIRHPVLEEH